MKTNSILELKRWDNGKVIHSGEFDSMKDLVEDAVRKGISLEFADLRRADLRWADLRWANLRMANLRMADMEGVNLRWADLRWADLRGVDFRGANLRGANLRMADMEGVNLRMADMEGVNLRGVDFYGAKLEGAHLYGAKLFGKSIMSLEIHSGINRDETYKYRCYAAITTQGEIFICMGCKRLTLGQWQANWKNNIIEFPTGSRKERQRRAVYDYLVAWAKIEVERLDTIYKRNPNGSFILEGAK